MNRTTQRLLPLLAVLAVAGTAACGDDHEFEPPDRDEQVEDALRAFDAVAFDSISWTSDSARRVAGEEIFGTKCRKCHGYRGEGGTEYSARRDLDVPSLVEPGWPYAKQPDSTRRQIFVGHREMPSFGLGRVTPRQIDAVTYYILEVLRPDVLKRGSRGEEEGTGGSEGSREGR